MSRSRFLPWLAAGSLLGWPAASFGEAPPSAQDEADETQELRREVAALRERLEALEARLESLTSAPPPPLPATGPGPSSKILNPDIAVTADFRGVAAESPRSGEPSLELHEAEASFQAIVDPYARADFFFAFGPEGVEIEEGKISFPAVPGGFLLKAGKQRASFGKVNTMHNHTLSWVDRPLVTENLVGGEEGLSDGGLSLSRLIPNPLLFLEATAEVYRGQNEVFSGVDRGDLTYVGRLRGYQDISESTNLDLGFSGAWGRVESNPGGTSRLLGVDATFRWRPLRRAIYRRLLARTELVWSRRDLEDGARDAFGFYASAEYQFARRWFFGVRWDESERAEEPEFRDRGHSVLLTFWPSEFSQVRGQFRRTRFGDDEDWTNELLFQLQFNIGAHGAHPF